MDDSIQWNTDAMSALLPMVKKLGGGLKSKTLCVRLLKHGRKKITVMLSQPEVLKAEYKRAKNGPVLQRKRTNKRRTQKRNASRRRKLEDTVMSFTHDTECHDEYHAELLAKEEYEIMLQLEEEDWRYHCENGWSSDEPDWDDLREEQIWEREHNRTDEERWNDTFGRCRGCDCGQSHSNPYFCDDNWRQREHDSWESLRDKD
jgi:hypothetical protein